MKKNMNLCVCVYVCMCVCVYIKYVIINGNRVI